MLRFEEVRGQDEITRARTEWDGLFARCPWATAFQSPEWLLAWCAAFEPENAFFILVRDGDTLVGLAPMYVFRRDGERVLLPIGAGISDSLDMLLAPDCADDAARALWKHLLAQRGRWDAIDFGCLAADSPFLRSAPSAAWPWDDEPWMGIDLASRQSLERLLAPWLLHNVHQARRRAERENVRVECVDHAALGVALERFVAAHSARWAERAQKGVFFDPRVLAFHREAVPLLHARGLVRLYRIRVGDAVPAVVYVLWHARRPAFYACGFDPTWKRLSPGVLLVARVIEDAIGEGAHAIDFLRGREAFKTAWGAAPERRCGVTFRGQRA